MVVEDRRWLRQVTLLTHNDISPPPPVHYHQQRFLPPSRVRGTLLTPSCVAVCAWIACGEATKQRFTKLPGPPSCVVRITGSPRSEANSGFDTIAGVRRTLYKYGQALAAPH